MRFQRCQPLGIHVGFEYPLAFLLFFSLLVAIHLLCVCDNGNCNSFSQFTSVNLHT